MSILNIFNRLEKKKNEIIFPTIRHIARNNESKLDLTEIKYDEHSNQTMIQIVFEQKEKKEKKYVKINVQIDYFWRLTNSQNSMQDERIKRAFFSCQTISPTDMAQKVICLLVKVVVLLMICPSKYSMNINLLSHSPKIL